MDKIAQYAKVKLTDINAIIGILGKIQQALAKWTSTSVANQAVYTLSGEIEMPSSTSSDYEVVYSSIVLWPEDYTIDASTKKITFVEATPEGGYPITVRYIGGVADE